MYTYYAGSSRIQRYTCNCTRAEQLQHTTNIILNCTTMFMLYCVARVFLRLFSKFCSHFSKILPTIADIKTEDVKETMTKIGYSVQGLVLSKNQRYNSKWLVCREPLYCTY